ncbi:hypothetical protein DFP73DRAFT_537234 [Morchella snyderi]|nr:hypothetical protein DFP73DRAFT_537234 [Morchella snyderi]
MASENALKYAKVLGIFTGGIATGSNFSTSFLVMPAVLYPRTTPPKDLHAQWKHIYDHGKFTLPPLAIVASAAFSYVAYHDEGLRVPYGIAAVSTLSMIPFTLVGMKANLGALLEPRAWGDADKGRLRELLWQWSGLNWYRAVMLGVGFATALVSAVF